MSGDEVEKPAAEFDAIHAVHDALQPLDGPARLRVIRYVAEVLKIPLRIDGQPHVAEPTVKAPIEENSNTPAFTSEEIKPPSADEEGISPVALKWMRRSGIDAKALQSIFSLGIDEIDLVAKAVPGKSIRAKLRSVVLLKAIASYLGTGSARVSYDQVKEAATHYSAYDQSNFAAAIGALSAEVGGSKDSGYTLAARGLAEATELVKSILDGK